MAVELEVDGSYFEFREGWAVEKLDDWPEQRRLTRHPFKSKGCDLAAINDGNLWLIEVNDYTYAGAAVPDDLENTVGMKVFHSLAILHSVARWGQGEHRDFSISALQARNARVCLAVELQDGGRKLLAIEKPLADLRARLNKALRPLGLTQRPVVSNSHLLNGVPWQVRRDPATRPIHRDR